MISDEPKKIRNAFVVDQEGNVESRDMSEKISLVVNNLENIRNILQKAKDKEKQ